MTSVHVIGTTDASEIAAVLAAVTAAAARRAQPSAYERWRKDRVAAVRTTLNER
jgi:hypothetical protein